MPKNILIIAPHHDDEVLGCGGSIAKKVAEGANVVVVYVTAGFSGVPDLRNKEEAIKLREKEAIKACKTLGVKKWFFLREGDRNLKFNLKTIQKLIKIIRIVNPNIVYLPHLKEGDFEHRLVSQMSQEALWMATSKYFPELGKVHEEKYESILFYEVWTPLTSPQFFEDISRFKDKKIEAIKCYSTQVKLISLTEAILGLNRYRGEMYKGVPFAEAFSVKSIGKI